MATGTSEKREMKTCLIQSDLSGSDGNFLGRIIRGADLPGGKVRSNIRPGTKRRARSPLQNLQSKARLSGVWGPDYPGSFRRGSTCWKDLGIIYPTSAYLLDLEFI